MAIIPFKDILKRGEALYRAQALKESKSARKQALADDMAKREDEYKRLLIVRYRSYSGDQVLIPHTWTGITLTRLGEIFRSQPWLFMQPTASGDWEMLDDLEILNYPEMTPSSYEFTPKDGE